MNFFLYKIINNKKHTLIIYFTVILFGFLFGLIKSNSSNNELIGFFQTIFYVDDNQQKYQLYLYQNIFYIFINTYLSTSYIGFFGISFLLFMKGIQLSFSFLYLLNISYNQIIIFIIIIEFLLEILITFISFAANFKISLQNIPITFLSKDNYNHKSVLNYHLNNLILVLFILVISLLVRMYLIDL